MLNVHFVFDLIAASCSGGLTFLLSRGVLARGLERVNTMGWVYYLGLSVGAIWGAFFFGSLNLWVSGEDILGRSILGALVGAILFVEVAKAWLGQVGSTGALFVPAFTISTVIGRWGCYFTGLEDQTVGVRTTLPWGVDFGDGPRHAVMLYESGAMAVFFIGCLYLMRFHLTYFQKYGFYLMCICYGGQRFLWEFLKPYGTVIGPFNVFHLCCIALIGYGICMMVAAQKRA